MSKPEENEKSVIVSIDKNIWKAARVLAIQQERPVKNIVADGLRLVIKDQMVLKRDQAQVEPLSHDKYSSERPVSGK